MYLDYSVNDLPGLYPDLRSQLLAAYVEKAERHQPVTLRR